MLSNMIGKIEKAMRYSQEPDRIAFQSFKVTVDGDHRGHTVTYNDGTWGCDCEAFEQTAYCSHTMTLERVLRDMIMPTWEDKPEANNGA